MLSRPSLVDGTSCSSKLLMLLVLSSSSSCFTTTNVSSVAGLLSLSFSSFDVSVAGVVPVFVSVFGDVNATANDNAAGGDGAVVVLDVVSISSSDIARGVVPLGTDVTGGG
jgi:hypothetical protein